jgi:hypothetical protein
MSHIKRISEKLCMWSRLCQLNPATKGPSAIRVQEKGMLHLYVGYDICMNK